jgi:hypothetical protein
MCHTNISSSTMKNMLSEILNTFDSQSDGIFLFEIEPELS